MGVSHDPGGFITFKHRVDYPYLGFRRGAQTSTKHGRVTLKMAVFNVPGPYHDVNSPSERCPIIRKSTPRSLENALITDVDRPTTLRIVGQELNFLQRDQAA